MTSTRRTGGGGFVYQGRERRVSPSLFISARKQRQGNDLNSSKESPPPVPLAIRSRTEGRVQCTAGAWTSAASKPSSHQRGGDEEEDFGWVGVGDGVNRNRQHWELHAWGRLGSIQKPEKPIQPGPTVPEQYRYPISRTVPPIAGRSPCTSSACSGDTREDQFPFTPVRSTGSGAAFEVQLNCRGGARRRRRRRPPTASRLKGPRKQKSFAYKLLKRGLANLMSPTSTSGVAPPLLFDY
ncbi:hypothetical protein EVAR_43876_1 [Eumeta japonica]|uniref:Uncharacterized protein n=1 Tax=Eumeta variegata TaxID=151549 RepID=A0A4C1WRC4_EUMVA|nr:hypothetical protein EVAR_43876_1 [Eumeta japonica]